MVNVCVCGGVCSHVHVWEHQKMSCPINLIILYLNPWRECLSVNWSYVDRQQVPVILLSYNMRIILLIDAPMPRYLCGCCGVKLRFSCMHSICWSMYMHSKCFHTLIYVPTTHVYTWILSLLSSQIGSSCWFALISVVVDLKQGLVLQTRLDFGSQPHSPATARLYVFRK